MFEPQKLITVGLAMLLLAPFGFVFWRIAVHQPRPEENDVPEFPAVASVNVVGGGAAIER